MRYTEIRMSKIADSMLEDIDKDTVDFIDNYDGSETEPTVLPSLFPNLLANGTNGIAVGMATNMPPHNLSEIIDAITMVAHNRECSIADIRTVLHGPDFPTGAQIVGVGGINDYFSTGRGSVIMRAKGSYTTNEHTGKSTIIFTEIPYQVNKTNLIKRIADLANAKEEGAGISGIADLRDESSREGIRIVIETKRDVSPEVLMNQLYKKTELQTSFPCNMLALVDGAPKLLNIKDALIIYIEHQLDVLQRRVKYDLGVNKDRQHILQGLHIALTNIDEVVKIIRHSETDEQASTQLKAKFGLDDKQTKAILDMRLRALCSLEHEKIENELKEIETEIARLEKLLADRNLQIEDIIARLEGLRKKFGDARQTEILESESLDITDEDLIRQEDILLTLSSRGYLKRLPIDTYRTQNRGGVGVIGATTYEDDDISRIIVANTHTDVLVFTNKGKIYRLRGHQFPKGSRIAKGLPAITILPSIEKGERVVTLLPIKEYDENHFIFFVTAKGIVKKTVVSEFIRINSNGKRCITVEEGDDIVDVLHASGTDQVLIGATNGHVVRFDNAGVRPMGRSARGVHGIRLESKDEVVGAVTNQDGPLLLSIGAHGIGKVTAIEEYRLSKRNAKGVKTLKVTPKTGNLVAIKSLEQEDQVLIITTKNKIIRIMAEQIREAGRNTQGVKLVNIDEGDKVRDVAILKKGLFDNIEEQPQQ
ncbi:MAG: DNA gyrase subunit A, partial [Malacoplasma sp.]|nr:DNA gyrase subunit A [Malacoplasma sp.]